jgi:hypothetical protein
VCIDPGGKWCPGGSIGCGRADEFVTRRFLDRCQFMIQGREIASFRDGERAWWEGLHGAAPGAAIASNRSDRARVVAGGDTPRREPGRRRELQIEWTPGAKGRREAVLVAEGVSDPELRHRVSDGRAEMMRDLEAAKLRAARDQRSQRARAYYKEWNKRLRSLSE